MKHLSTILRWLARILGILIILMVIVFAIAEGGPSPSQLTGLEKAMFGGLIIMMLGAIAAWKWEMIGGIVILLGYGWFWYIEGSWTGIYFAVFPLAGLLHLIAWLLDHKPAESRTTVAEADRPESPMRSKSAIPPKKKRKKSSRGW